MCHLWAKMWRRLANMRFWFLLPSYPSKGKHHTAVAKFKDALEHDFQQLEALFNISLQYQKMDKFEAQIKALELLKEVCLKFKKSFTSCVSLCQSRHNCTGEWSVKTASLRAALALSAAGRVFLRLTERSVKSRGELALPEICKPLAAWLALLLKASNFSTKKCLFKYKILTVVKWHFQLSQWNQIISQQIRCKTKNNRDLVTGVSLCLKKFSCLHMEFSMASDKVNLCFDLVWFSTLNWKLLHRGREIYKRILYLFVFLGYQG